MDSRQLIVEADRIAREQGLTQAEWCRKSGYDEFGKLISNTVSRGDCKLKVFLQILKPLGYEIAIVKTNDEGRNGSGLGINSA